MIHKFSILAPIAFALTIMSSSVFADTHSSVVHQQKEVGPYRLMLQVGPAETMVAHRKGTSGEVMLGGKMALCADPSSNMGGMSMGRAIMCNRHIEVHVFDRKSGQVVAHAHVTITLYNVGTRKTIQVPIMRMVGVTVGASDLHYGNNINAAAGRYTATISINRVRATFLLHLT